MLTGQVQGMRSRGVLTVEETLQLGHALLGDAMETVLVRTLLSFLPSLLLVRC